MTAFRELRKTGPRGSFHHCLSVSAGSAARVDLWRDCADPTFSQGLVDASNRRFLTSASDHVRYSGGVEMSKYQRRRARDGKSRMIFFAAMAHSML